MRSLIQLTTDLKAKKTKKKRRKNAIEEKPTDVAPAFGQVVRPLLIFSSVYWVSSKNIKGFTTVSDMCPVRMNKQQ